MATRRPSVQEELQRQKLFKSLKSSAQICLLPQPTIPCSCRLDRLIFIGGHFSAGVITVCALLPQRSTLSCPAHQNQHTREKTWDKRVKENDVGVGGMLSSRNAILCLEPKRHQTVCVPPPPLPFPGCCQRPRAMSEGQPHPWRVCPLQPQSLQFAHCKCAPSTQIYQLNEWKFPVGPGRIDIPFLPHSAENPAGKLLRRSFWALSRLSGVGKFSPFAWRQVSLKSFWISRQGGGTAASSRRGEIGSVAVIDEKGQRQFES